MDTSEHPDVPVGTMFEGKYRIEGVLGSGGMGRVFEATHTLLDKRVALKVLRPEYASDPQMVARMTREARAASATGHPNVALVTDMGSTGERPFIVMELLRGDTLAVRIKRGRIPLRQALRWMSEILDALAAVHDSGVIHRDLKPENIILVPTRDGRHSIKILDFGISKLAREGDGAGQAHTKTGSVLGTPYYMAPEQARARADLDARIDLHAAGSLLYAMLCGQPPFFARSITATLLRVVEGEFTPLSQRIEGVPPGLDAILAKALAVDREARYANADAMRRALAALDLTAATNMSTQVDGSLGGPPQVEVEDANTRPFDPFDSPQLAPVNVTEVDASPESSYPTASMKPSGETELQLDVPEGWKAGAAASPPPKTSSSSGPNWLWIGMLVVLVAAGVGVWTQWDRLSSTSSATGEAEEGEQILLLVDTVPSGAIVFIDDVQHNERPIEIPRSTDYVKVRVEAPGFQPHIVQIQPSATRRIKVELKR